MPGTAPHRVPRAARSQRGGSHRPDQPHHPGLVGLLPGRGLIQDLRQPGQPPVGTCYKWATFSHATKPKKWIVARYFGKHNKFRNDHWVFGDATSGAHLVKLAWTSIVRHTMVKGTASPDDPALAEYWASRRRRLTPPLDSYTLRLLAKQDGRCPLCRDLC
jgi:hypothetical protein